MKPLFFTTITFLLIQLGFTQSFPPENFELTTDTQTATFYIGVGWVGIGASMPILNRDIYRPKKLNGLDIYLDESYHSQVNDQLPGCYKGHPNIMVTAKICLKEKRVSVSSNPPGQRTIYEAVVLEWIDLVTESEPCVD